MGEWLRVYLLSWVHVQWTDDLRPRFFIACNNPAQAARHKRELLSALTGAPDAEAGIENFFYVRGPANASLPLRSLIPPLLIRKASQRVTPSRFGITADGCLPLFRVFFTLTLFPHPVSLLFTYSPFRPA